MKNSDTVQLVVLIVALIAGYHAFIEIPEFLWHIIKWFNEGLTLTGHFTIVVSSSIYLAINIIIVFILINRSKQITRYIIDRSEYKGELKIPQTKDDLLSVMFVATGVYLLVTRLPDLITGLYNYYKEKTSEFPGSDIVDLGYITPRNNLVVLIIEVSLSTLLIIYSQQFADYFSKKVNNRDPVEEIGSSENNS